MKEFLIVAFGAGLHDGLNPCIFITCTVFIIFGFWSVLSFWRNIWYRFIFGLFYVLSSLILNFEPFQLFISLKQFIFIDKAFYFVLGLWSFILAVLFFKDWILLYRGFPVEEKIKPIALPGFLFYLMTIILAVILSILATLWPVNNYVTILGSTAILKGQWRLGLPLLGTYFLCSMWPLWFVCAFLSIKKLRTSLFKITLAGIFFTASTSMVFIFK